MTSAASWWACKVRQFRRYLIARVSDAERAELATWLTPAQLILFDAMPVADQRHGLDVAARLRANQPGDRDLQLAALFHDAGKGQKVRLWHRVAWSLGEVLGPWVHRFAARLPGGSLGMQRMRRHAERSADLAIAAGCPVRTGALIRGSVAPADAAAAAALHLADEAS